LFFSFTTLVIAFPYFVVKVTSSTWYKKVIIIK